MSTATPKAGRSVSRLCAAFAAALSLVVLVAAICSANTSQYVGKVQLGYRTYFAEVVVAGSTASVWLRVSENQHSTKDKRLATLTVKSITITPKKVQQLICSGKKVYDDGKMLVGCGSLVVSGACLVGAVPTGGLSLLACSVTIGYTAMTGAKDCIMGAVDKIADVIGGSQEWSAYASHSALSAGDLSDGIEYAMDAWCASK